MIDAGTIRGHFPELAVGARENVVFCSCGAEFRARPQFAGTRSEKWNVADLWASHVAAELNGVRA